MESLLAGVPRLAVGEYFLLGTSSVILAVCVTLYQAVYTLGEYSDSGLPLAGEPPGKKTFSLRTRLRYYYDAAALYTEAYQKYAKQGKAILVPGYGSRADLVLPESSVEWAITQPDATLSLSQAFLQANHSTYSLGHSRYWGDGWQFSLVKTQLNDILSTLIPAVQDELHHAMPKYFGTETQSWKEIDVGTSVQMLVGQTSSRFNVGLPLCRNEEYLDRTQKIIKGVMITAIAGNVFPGFLLPIVGRLTSLHTWYNISRVKKHLKPQYTERLAALGKEKEDQPQDQLQIMMRFAQKKRPQELNDVNIMATRLVAANFVAMHQTSDTLTTMLLNIMDSDAKYNTIEVLREEAKRVLGNGEVGWNKENCAAMTSYDSVARETMRCSFPFGTRGLLRKVMKDDVVTNLGVPLKKGSIVSFLASAAQMDPGKYENALEFDPWRFSRVTEKDRKEKPGEEFPVTSTGHHPQAFVTTSPEYLTFGHGKHACPGRFLVDFELKMIVAYILQHYDLKFPDECKGRAPPMKHVAELNMPPPGARILVKKRVL
ncbi:Cytochrome P450 [Venustampulla echinocandica]|uniref:Cytochrome P450 n=1 Tax=Venustampulla echinocandica TaxID=2656787 RepID=A0A370TE23_9HELO|nr:Cytochrome P450 [Venustampulla echinocandica]RDL32692.1 Cytochrome P450 [Venustampulla echinocandica]